MTIESIVGNLNDAYSQLVPGTFYTTRQLMDERCAPVDTPERRERRSEWHYAADGHIYTVEGNKVEWSITDENNNLILQNLETAFRELTQNHNYRPSNEASHAARSAASTLRVDMSFLRLSGEENEWRYLAIETATGRIKSGEEYVALNETERAVLNHLGYTAANLAELQKAKIRETRINVLNPVYVKTKVAEDPQKRDSVARASWLSNFDIFSSFSAYGRNINYNDRVRGVRRESVVAKNEVPRAPAASSEISADRCYDILLANPKSAVAALDDTKAAGLSRILEDYHAIQKS